VGVDRFIELWRAAGFADPAPDDARFTEAEVELVRTFEAAAGQFGEAATMQLLRVVGASVSRVADAAVSTFITTLGVSAMAADPVTGALAEANLAAAALFPQLSAAMDGLLRHHLVDAARPNVTGVSSGFETVTTVGFVDVVGSTGLATHLPLGDIGRAIASFEEHAANAVAASGGRVVKFIGDEVMFRVHDPAAACHVALTIVARFSDDEVLPGARRGGLRRPPRTRRRLLRPGRQRRGACDEAGPAGDGARDRVRAGRRAGGRRAAIRGRAPAATEGLRQPRHAVRRRGGLTCLFALRRNP
jgi:class 3 adenylate cyclase